MLALNISTLVLIFNGSRDWTDIERIDNMFLKLGLNKRNDVVLYHGDCRGADKLAESVAIKYGIKVVSFPADWKKHKNAAGPIRNKEMLTHAKENDKEVLLLAFPKGLSKGTRGCMKLAREMKIKIINNEDIG